MDTTVPTPEPIIKQGFEILKTQKKYSQTIVVKKLKTLGFQTNPSSLSNFLKGKPVGDAALNTLSSGIQMLLKKECCLRWEDAQNDFEPIPDCTPEIVPDKSEKEKNGIQFYKEGRLDIADKVRFFSTAQKEMIEFGLTLNTFTGYFFRRRPDEFKLPIYRLLERGVNIKCYLLDPNCNEARLFFEDRKNYYVEEGEGTDKIRRTLMRFKTILKEIEEYGFEGKMEVYTYKHIPCQYTMVIDKDDSSKGKLQLSHYLYGELRSHCPVLECHRKDNTSLFMLYCSSLQKLIKGAKKVTDFDKYAI